MSDAKLSQLPVATSSGDSDLLYLVQSNQSKRLPLSTLFANAANVSLSGVTTLGGTPQTLGSPGIVNITTPITHLSADATGGTLQIPAGTQGQFKLLTMTATAGGSYTVATSNIAGNTSIVFDAVGDTVLLYFTNSKWAPVASSAALDLTSISSNVIPSADSVYNLGSPTNQWKSLYVSNNTIFIGGTPLTIENGDLTIPGSIVSSNSFTVVSEIGATSSGVFLDGANNVILFATSNAIIRSDNDGTFKDWTFSADGNLTAPGTISANTVNATNSFGLPVYATDAARDTAIPSPQTGMMVYVSGGEGAGLQVRGANNWNTVSQTSN